MDDKRNRPQKSGMKHQDELIQEIARLRDRLAAKDNQFQSLTQELNQLKSEHPSDSRHRYHNIFDSMQESLAIAEIIPDATGRPNDFRLIELNKACARMINVSQDAARGKTLLQLFPGADPNWLELFRDAAACGEPIQFEKYSPALSKWVSVRVFCPETDKLAILFIDITERKQAEEKLRRLNETLELRIAERTELAETRAKQLQVLVSELTLAEQRERRRLAEILHDHLQQLLVAAKFNCELLAERTDTNLKQAAENIIDLILQSIQASRSLTTELSPPYLQQGRLTEALKWLARWMKENQGLAIEIDFTAGIDPAREDIAVLLFQSVRELLLNVVKHAGVKSANLKITHDENNRLKVSVSDQGAGFDPKNVWEMAKTGVGFGLFSIRERLALIGGSMDVESSPGKGSSFSLFVPQDTPVKTAEPSSEEKVLRPIDAKMTGDIIRVLVADDHPLLRQGLSTMLDLQPDIKVVAEAADGHEAVRLTRKFNPDVVLMDNSMPQMDGLEATRIIHAEMPHVRIIGLSMYDENEQVAAMIDAGVSEYHSKSENTALLIAAIRGKVD